MKDWFYGKSGQQYGPIDESTLRARIATNEVGRNDLLWTDGMAQWTPLREMPEFYDAPVPPPISSGSPPPTTAFAQSPDSPYAAPASGFAPPQAVIAYPPTNGLATASLVLGILSLLCGGPLLGIPAVICGHMGLAQIKRSGGQQEGGGKAIAGLVTGYISIAMTLGFFALVAIGS